MRFKPVFLNPFHIIKIFAALGFKYCVTGCFTNMQLTNIMNSQTQNNYFIIAGNCLFVSL